MSIPENRTLRGAVIDYTSDRKLPLNECKIYFSPVQVGEGTPSPENVREISGWDSVTVYGFNKRLPNEYCEVEYLESTGTQWIDSGILTGQNLKILAKIRNTITGSKYAYGVRNSNATITYANGSNSVTGYVRWGDSAYSNKAPNGIAVIEQDASGVVINDTKYTYSSVQTVTPLDGYTIAIFAAKTTAIDVSSNFVGEIYYFQIYDGETPLRNFIPCYRISDHTPGMFDLVTNQFYTNSGTGNFILGPEVGITIDFPKTIYGGYVDLIRGEIVETHEMFQVDGTETNIRTFDAGLGSHRFDFYIKYLSGDLKTTTEQWISDKFIYSGGNNKWGTYGFYNTTNLLFRDSDNQIADLNAFKEWLSENTPTFVAPLVTPNTYSISPQDLRLLRGANKFSSNLNGDIEISFAAEEYPQLSGNIVTFNSPVAGKQFEECKVYFTPKQDLHGYSKPWVGGSGKNKLNESLFGDSTSRTTLAVQLNPNTTYTLSTNIPQQLITILTQNTNLESSGNPYNGHPCTFTTTENGEITLSYYNGSSVAIKDYQTQIEVGSTATSYEPYENICPIEGWNGIELYQANNNIINSQWEQGAISADSNNVKGIYDKYKVNNATQIRCVSLIPLDNTKTYKIIWNTNVYKVVTQPYDINGYAFKPNSPHNVWQTESYEFGSLSNVAIAIRRKDGANITISEAISADVKLISDYTILDITFPKTIYGGYVDLVNGEIVETYDKYEFTGNESLGWHTWGNDFYIVLLNKDPSKKSPLPFKATENGYCNMLQNVKSRMINIPSGSISAIGVDTLPNFTYLVANNSGFGETLEECKAKLQELYANGTPLTYIGEVKSVYLETIYTYPIDPITLTTLRNTNTLFSNANGNITVRAIGNVPSPIHSSDLLRREINGAPYIESKTGNYLTFNTDMEMPLTSGKIYFSPKQDLHGYSKPWVGGAGKNKFDATSWFPNIQKYSGSAQVFRASITLKPNTIYIVSTSCPNSKTVNTYDDVFAWGGISTISGENPSTANEGVNSNSPRIITSDSNGIISIGIRQDTSVNFNFNGGSYYIQVEEGSTATAYEPYENICPIEGWDGIEVIKCGKNLIDIQDMKDTYPWGSNTTYKGYTLFVGSNKTVTISHLTDIANGCDFYVNVGVKASQKGISGAPYWIYHKSAPSMRNKQLTVTADNDGRIYINVYAIGTKGLDQFYTFLLDDGFQIEYGDTVTTWEPFNSFETIVIPFNRTIYGGYVDLVSGEVVETWNSKTIDGTNIQDYAGNEYSGTQCTNRYLTFVPNSSQSYQTNTAISNYLESKKYAVWSNANNYPNCFTINGGYQLHVCFLNDIVGITSNDSNTVKTNKIKAYLTNHPMQLVYPLKTADMGHYSFTMQPITTLSGTNNFWTTANGDAQISYYRHSDDSYQYINAQAIASNNNYLLVTDDGFVIGTEENVTVY